MAAKIALTVVLVSLAACSPGDTEVCDYLHAIPDLDEAEFTPRASRHLEAITMICSEGLFPDPGLYDALEADWSAIVDAYPILATVRHHHLWVKVDTALPMRAATPEDVTALVESDEFACLVDLLDGTVEADVERAWVTVSTQAVVDTLGFIPIIESIPLVDSASGDDITDGGDSVMWREVDGAREWRVQRYLDWGTSEHGFWFRMSADGEPELVAEWAHAHGSEHILDDPAIDPDLPLWAPEEIDWERWGCSRCNGDPIRMWEPGLETCDNGIDDDCDHLVDCDDPVCADDPACPIEDCRNGIDDDGDAWVDCNDLECKPTPACGECTMSHAFRSAPFDDEAFGEVLRFANGCESRGRVLEVCVTDRLAPEGNLSQAVQPCVECWIDWLACIAGSCPDVCEWGFDQPGCSTCAGPACADEVTLCLTEWLH